MCGYDCGCDWFVVGVGVFVVLLLSVGIVYGFVVSGFWFNGFCDFGVFGLIY